MAIWPGLGWAGGYTGRRQGVGWVLADGGTGRVPCTASGAGLKGRGQEVLGAYGHSAAKGGVIPLAQGLAAEGGALLFAGPALDPIAGVVLPVDWGVIPPHAGASPHGGPGRKVPVGFFWNLGAQGPKVKGVTPS